MDEIDYISDLPNEIIGNILSRIPSTEEVVQTCMLSKKWRYKWCFITRVNFDDTAYLTPDGDIDAPRFLRFMRGTLLGVQNVVGFDLDCQLQFYEDPNALASCIDIAFRSPVEISTICNRSRHALLRLPAGVLNCRSLESLELRNVEANIPASVVVPNLKSFHLTGVNFLNEDPKNNTVRITVPVLEVCYFSRCSWQNIEIMEIAAPELTVLYSSTSRRRNVDGCTIMITGARIENFSANHGYPANFRFPSSTVQQATMHCEVGVDTLQTYGLQFRKLLKELSGHLKELEIFDDITESIARTKLDALQGDVPHTYVRWAMCFRLEQLEAGNNLHKEGLLELLSWTPYLKHLSVEFHPRFAKWPNDGLENFEIASCTRTNLEVVEFEYFIGTDNQYELIQYLIENGAVLKSFMISTLLGDPDFPAQPRALMLRQLRSFHRASNHVRIMLDETDVDENDVDEMVIG